MDQLLFTTYLSPRARPLYEFATKSVGEDLGVPTELIDGGGYDTYADEAADVAFVCGLPYVFFEQQGVGYVPIAAPVLRGDRYAGRPVYFSDVVVRADSPLQTFADLRGANWACNEILSQSGYGLPRHHMVSIGETAGYFDRVIHTGSHAASIQCVLDGEADAAAIDSHVLSLHRRDEPRLAGDLRVVEILGPSTIQPVVASKRLSAADRADITSSLAGLHTRPDADPTFERAMVDRFVPIDSSRYNDIREMLAASRAAAFEVIR